MASFRPRMNFEEYQRAARYGDTSKRQEAMTELARFARESGEPYRTQAIEALIRALGDTAREIRATAATLLGLIGDLRAADALALALKDNDQQVAHSAALSLAELGDARGKHNLVATLGAIRKALQNAGPGSKEVLKRVEAGIVKALGKLSETPDRNVPCPCGSGKKYVLCCGTKRVPQSSTVKCTCGFENPAGNKFCNYCGKRMP